MAAATATTFMGGVLQLARHLAQSSAGAAAAVKVCQSQCNILSSAFACLAEYASEAEQLAAINRQEASIVAAELLGCLRRCLQLIRSCEAQEWLVTTLLCEDRREDFRSVHSQLYDSVDLLSAYLYQACTSAEEKARLCGAYRRWIENRKNTEGAAANDKRHLMRLSVSEEDGEEEGGSSPLRLLSHMILEKSAPEMDAKQLQLSQHLGQGGFGTVYEAIWFSWIFAVKVFPAGDTSFRSFQRELAALSSNKHPNVLAIVGFARSDTGHFLVMERMDMDLASLLMKKRLSTLDAINILLQIAQGMAWLHSRDVIHRDLKPQNVLTAGDGEFLRVKIADFGLSRTNFVTSQVTYATWKEGTRLFMAPEVWNSEHYSKTSDVFSYAMICYQVLTGRMPYDDMEALDANEFMLRVSNGLRPTGEFPASCPQELVELTRLCWSSDPHDRPQFSEVCSQLKLLKGKIITGIRDFTEIRKNLFGSSSDSSFAAAQFVASRSRSSSRFKEERQGSSTHTPSSGGHGSSSSDSHTNSYSAAKTPQVTVNPRQELTALTKKGKITEAFTYALSLNDSATVWWLCSKMEPSLLLALSQQMVMQILEQINEDLDMDTEEKVAWIEQGVDIVASDYKSWSSPRLERFFQRLCENLHGQLAHTPRQTDHAEFLSSHLAEATEWLKRSRRL